MFKECLALFKACVKAWRESSWMPDAYYQRQNNSDPPMVWRVICLPDPQPSITEILFGKSDGLM